MKKVLITGVAGFLGSYLAKNLLAEGHQVIGVDNLSTGKLTNVEGILEDSNFTFIQEDVSNTSWISQDIFNNIEEIFHLASPASPKFYQELWLNTMKVNTIGTKNVLELAKVNNAKILFASTSEAYGDPEVHPQPEDYRGNVNTWGPRACYDEAKRMGEVLCYEYYTRYEVKVKVVRIFNTYSAGLRNDDGRVISNFVTQALTGSDITVYGIGDQTRSFCYVDDNIRGLKLMMATEEATGNITNIGNPTEYSILEVAELVKRLTNSDSKITFHPLPKDDPKVRRPDITKASTMLGWEPEISLEEGLKRTIEVYKRNLVLA
ncbi:UDP-glucose 4-epimerase [Bacillus mobilis]|uniref:UDP-glucuronate decarboxylase n=1 Tax=Bacillus mobilis TaxID=2026190 RepID=A0A1Y5Z1L7_9BACI|nr:UDP-glucuronic acid decarboxylase family protein [Bacillus mobilis]SMD72746.1 UDP-glucose 4-epimerase [Bacillus mobilis]